MTHQSARIVLGHQLRDHRKLAGVSLSAAALELGKSVGHLSNVEAGRDTPSWDIVAFYEDRFHADGQLWTAYVEVQVGPRPPQRTDHRDRPAYPVPGDASSFVADVTVPDGTIMPPEFIFEKIWRIRNSGSVPWIGRRLVRDGAAAGYGIPHSPSYTPIEHTMPGETVDVAVPLRAQVLAGTSQARWKMVDQQGWQYFPDRYPCGLFLTIIVREGAAAPDLRHWS